MSHSYMFHLSAWCDGQVSKTYSGVQALREVSFSMKRGEVFVMLGGSSIRNVCG